MNTASGQQQESAWDKTERLFLAALELPECERAGFLESQTAGDAALKEEVASLLSYDSGAGSLPEMFAAAAAELAPFHMAPQWGQRIGAYQIGEPLGEGGMGIVYLATRADDEFQQKVAIKVIKRGMDTNAMLARFRQERQILANLDHPYIARLLDGGSTEGNQPFFVMEYVEGGPIDGYCKSNNLTIRQRCELFLRVCEAVAYAHRNLIMHRDLKPGNILVTQDGAPKLLDFGVAKLFDSGAGDEAHTSLTQRPLTPEYASPEQVRGLAVTTATDTYSLALVLYEILTGARARVFADRSPSEVERIVCETALPRTSSAAGALPTDLKNILAMALRVEPERRYSSVEHFAADIQRYLEDRPVAARPDTLTYRGRKFIRRNRGGVAATVLVMMSIAGGVVFSLREASNARAARVEADASRVVAERERNNALDHAGKAELSRAAAVREHATAEEQRALAQTEAHTARAEEQRAKQRLTRIVELANHSLLDVHGVIERLPGATAARESIVKTTLAYLEATGKDAGAMDDRLRLALATAYFRVGDIEGNPEKPSLGKTKEALQSYQRAQTLLAPLMNKRPHQQIDVLTLFIDLLRAQAKTLEVQGRPKEGIAPLLQALDAARELARMAPDDSREADVQNSLVTAYRSSQPEQAMVHARQGILSFAGLAARQPDNTEFRWGLSTAHSMLGSMLSERADLDAALENFQASMRLREAIVARDPNDMLYRRSLMIAYGQVASIYIHAGRGAQRNPAEARVYFRKAVAIGQAMAASDKNDRLAKYDLASGELRLASLEFTPATYTENLTLLTQAGVLLEELLRDDPRSIRYLQGLSFVHLYKGSTFGKAGEDAAALTEFRAALARFSLQLEAQPRDIFATGGWLSAAKEVTLLLAKQGDRGGARELAEKAVSVAGSQPATAAAAIRGRRLADALLTLATIELQFHDWSAARTHAQQSVLEWNKLLGPNNTPMFLEELASAGKVIAESNRQLGLH